MFKENVSIWIQSDRKLGDGSEYMNNMGRNTLSHCCMDISDIVLLKYSFSPQTSDDGSFYRHFSYITHSENWFPLWIRKSQFIGGALSTFIMRSPVYLIVENCYWESPLVNSVNLTISLQAIARTFQGITREINVLTNHIANSWVDVANHVTQRASYTITLCALLTAIIYFISTSIAR